MQMPRRAENLEMLRICLRWKRRSVVLSLTDYQPIRMLLRGLISDRSRIFLRIRLDFSRLMNFFCLLCDFVVWILERRNRYRGGRWETARRSLSSRRRCRGWWIYSSIRFTATKTFSWENWYLMLRMWVDLVLLLVFDLMWLYFYCWICCCFFGIWIWQALDKIRFLALTDKEVLGEGDDAKLEILVSFVAYSKKNGFFFLYGVKNLSKRRFCSF